MHVFAGDTSHSPAGVRLMFLEVRRAAPAVLGFCNWLSSHRSRNRVEMFCKATPGSAPLQSSPLSTAQEWGYAFGDGEQGFEHRLASEQVGIRMLHLECLGVLDPPFT